LVIPAEKDTTESVTLTTQVTRLAGVQNGLFGLEGQVVVSAPGKEPVDVTGESFAVSAGVAEVARREQRCATAKS
jgi:hypothetical protein